MPTVTVLWFAALGDQRGLAVETLDVAEGTTLAALYEQLIAPSQGGRIPVGYAQNACVVTGDHPVEDGAEIVFLPPVGGG